MSSISELKIICVNLKNNYVILYDLKKKNYIIESKNINLNLNLQSLTPIKI